jgi:hypothetical protein
MARNDRRNSCECIDFWLLMVANPDLKSGFQTDSNPDLTKNCDP